MTPFQLSVLEFSVAAPASVLTSGTALAYLRRVRLERPAIGTFNSRDIRVLFTFIVFLPFLYGLLPHWALTTFLSITFASALSIGLRPLLSPAMLWIVVGTLIGGSIWLNRTMLGTVWGWQLCWLEGDLMVLLAAVAISNLYVQGGMKFKHVAWFALILACYDLAFTTVLPVNSHLAEEFLGWPLDPSFGMRVGLYNATIGVGDLLVYSLFLIAAFKAYGRTAARIAMALIVVFGAVAVSVAPLVLDSFITARTDVAIPAQTLFGPAAFVAYLWMRRHYGRERTMQEFLASSDVVRPTGSPAAAPAPLPTPVPEPAAV
ncbi:hypothetical protein [Jatrophihabitans sp.]|uniref:hypothetical protein n=1 Tax=Jatrophihabitans sp. TaxID=1932789 RepID=UPI002BCC7F33|nr:hypothetical protein [Jatrophihabitans sp.]